MKRVACLMGIGVGFLVGVLPAAKGDGTNDPFKRVLEQQEAVMRQHRELREYQEKLFEYHRELWQYQKKLSEASGLDQSVWQNDAFKPLNLATTPTQAVWVLYEDTWVDGIVSGDMKPGAVLRMISGRLYEVTNLVAQAIAVERPRATVLRKDTEFRITIFGLDNPVYCKELLQSPEIMILPEPPAMK